MNTTQRSTDEIDAKIRKYEQFIDQKLRPDLEATIAKRNNLEHELAQYLQLRNTLEMIREQKLKKYEQRVDIGCHFFVQAEVEDLSKIMVKLKKDVFVELSQEEALQFVSKKEKSLNVKIDKLSEKVANIKAHIAFVIEANRELLQLEFQDRPQTRTLY